MGQPVTSVLQVKSVRPDQQDHAEKLALLVKLVASGRLEVQVLKGMLVHKALMEIRVRRVRQELVVLQDQMATAVETGPKDKLVNRERSVPEVKQEVLEL